eukprot:CAMPEP_0184370838 /NCGR_PEP_ID=MMETSP1089-20130417/163058_1 /TAXON_ID=38269 ORGANISM="Gloeochaete wittrockiana, Strain SAG46.84" /NCGR_SAMPLE_ID=MMETSP1089 /ASSEMBLY_ACC=CAM_ASM_000445 /LENGTH=381 /DNA_ID=CAMNT_0026713509 /DNA_START=32 /DNA_END=1177 /DNA_ORIENTATION=+
MSSSVPPAKEQPSPTLFISNLPSVFTEDLLARTFQRFSGYKGSRIRKDKNGLSVVVGFVDFENVESALHAKSCVKPTDLSPSCSIYFSKPRTGGASGTVGTPGRPETMFVGTVAPPSPAPQTLIACAVSPPTPRSLAEPSSTLYIEGLPLDATEREVSHLFRPFPGYRSVRICAKESKQHNRVFLLCFVEFDSKHQASMAHEHLQGYKFSETDRKGLRINYAKTERRDQHTPSSPSTPRFHGHTLAQSVPLSSTSSGHGNGSERDRPGEKLPYLPMASLVGPLQGMRETTPFSYSLFSHFPDPQDNDDYENSELDLYSPDDHNNPSDSESDDVPLPSSSSSSSSHPSSSSPRTTPRSAHSLPPSVSPSVPRPSHTFNLFSV